ncbi:hypothetical protein EI77_03789 [Prosthecobacter fusiformis]|uniref:Uncharacterized protein n=1 Tax=Prosthecobacter fusiformis TaxID=48464 RepID=A0A4R7RLA5_9BACT|nr:hypothetical protein [Prosthecobacter fusiformis]TDU66052.1 hypothetical protein EI77_03789 [Prosthecobacter fusiformis]
MKAFTPLFLTLLAAAQLSAAPLASISTLTGKTYRQCEIVKVHPDGVSFTHANGAAKVLFTDLSQEWRNRLGYDPAKAAAYQREQEERRQEQAAIRREHEQQRSEALLMAQQMELARLRGIEVQARAAQEAAAKAPQNTASVVPVLPAIGAVHDSSDYRGVGYRDSSFGYYPPYNGFGGYYGGGYYGGGYSYPIYRSCAPFHGSHHHFGSSIRGRVGGVTFSIGR